MKKKNIAHTVKMIGFILLLTAGAAGTIISLLLLILKSFESINIALFIASAVVTYIAIKGIILINANRRRRIIRDVKENGIGLISHWSIGQKEWSIYLTEQKTKDKSDLKSYGIMTAIISFIVALILFAWTLPWLISTVYALAVSAFLSTAIMTIMTISQRNQHKKLSVSKSGEIFFSEDAIIMNETVISFNQMGQRISNFELDKERTTPVLNIEITTSAGERSNQKEYSIPVNTSQMDEVDKVMEFCSNNT